MPEVVIPSEWTPEKILTRIIDTSANLRDRLQLQAEILRADVICIVYALDNLETLDNVTRVWLPYIRNIGHKVPIILIGNKLDLCNETSRTFSKIKHIERAILSEFREIEACIRCSAKKLFNIVELFYLAQGAVLYPLKPLYDYKYNSQQKKKLSDNFVAALKRIFILSNNERDGYLSDYDIMKLQSKCFGPCLLREEIDKIKNATKQKCPDGVDDRGIKENGFMEMIFMFIERGNLQVPWTILRKFGYDDSLRLRDSMVNPEFKVPRGHFVELSSEAYKFLVNIFRKYDKDNDGTLNPKELDELFLTAPGNPWDKAEISEMTSTSISSAITIHGFLNLFSMTTFLDHQKTLAYFFYLGFENDTRDALKITSSYNKGKRKSSRGVFLCYVFGSTGSGKTSLLRSFLNKPFNKSFEVKKIPYTVVNNVEIGGAEKYLIMQEIDRSIEFEVINNDDMMKACDVACLLYDSGDPNSFSRVAEIVESSKLSDVQVLILETKVDYYRATQIYSESPTSFCKRHNILPCVPVSFKESRPEDVYALILSLAMKSGIAKRSSMISRHMKILRFLGYTASTTAIIALLVISNRIFKKGITN